MKITLPKNPVPGVAVGGVVGVTGQPSGGVGVMFLTAAELSRELKICVDTLHRLVRMGLPFHQVGLRRRFVLVEVERWINTGDKE